MNNNYNYFNAYSDPYFRPTSFDLDITNPSFHKFNKLSILDWSYLNQYMLQPQYYEQDWDDHHHPSSSQWGYNSPESYYQQSGQHLASYTQYQDQPIEAKFFLEKIFEAFLETTRQLQISTDSNSQVQDPYSIFQVPP